MAIVPDTRNRSSFDATRSDHFLRLLWSKRNSSSGDAASRTLGYATSDQWSLTALRGFGAAHVAPEPGCRMIL
jgi:hypothetical protein